MFKIDEQLKNDSYFICDLSLSQLRLVKKSSWPWLLLVPRVEGVTEIFQLSDFDQATLMKEMVQVSRLVKSLFSKDKCNIASFGNVVSQLHVHIMGRSIGDTAWPGPAWVNMIDTEYTQAEAEKIIDLIKKSTG